MKNTASCARVPLLADRFRQAAFVHVVRHPAAVVMSLLRTDFWHGMTLCWDGRTTQQYAVDEQLSAEAVAARHWSRQVETAARDLAGLEPRRVQALRYESFLEDPWQTLGRLGRLGLTAGETIRARKRVTQLSIRTADPPAVPPEVRAAVEQQCPDAARLVGVEL